MSEKTQKNKMKNLADAVQECHISAGLATPSILLDDKIDKDLLSKWPKLKMKVPTIFLHKTVDFAQHVKKLLKLDVKFYQPYLGTNYTKIFCKTFNDHKEMHLYFEKNQLPYHTFGNPIKRKMKIVIRGLPVDTDLNEVKGVLKSASIPIIRIHKMHVKANVKHYNLILLVVVPYNDQGMKMLTVKKLLGHDVQLEPPKLKTRQCHRCQKWGHSQRYCHGQVKCVKCAGDHDTRKCDRDPETTEPPTCANCGGNHTANYRECFCCPDSVEYKRNRNRNKKLNNINANCTNNVNDAAASGSTAATPKYKERELVTFENCEMLYRKVKFIPNHTEAIPF